MRVEKKFSAIIVRLWNELCPKIRFLRVLLTNQNPENPSIHADFLNINEFSIPFQSGGVANCSVVIALPDTLMRLE